MCGFFFIHSKKNNIDFIKKSTAIALNEINHRGPNSKQQISIGNNSFGHVRLSIQDLSSNANQPFFSLSKKNLVIFNGEIYNHLELRKKYLSNFNWKTNSDTETLIELFEYLGFDTLLSEIIGMYSFVIYSIEKKIIFTARDQYGEKPNYIFNNNDFIIITSDLKTILKNLQINKSVNIESVNSFLKYGFIPSLSSIINESFQLPNNSNLTINLKSTNIINLKYLKNKINTNPVKIIKNDQGINISFNDIFNKIINYTKISDVEVGATLSGGIDSTIVAYFLNKNLDTKLQTFNLKINDTKYDESEKALRTANLLNTKHHIVELSTQDIKNYIEIQPSIFSEPFGDTSQIPTYYLFKYISNYLKVCIGGDGSDELFKGYKRYQNIRYLKILNKINFKSKFLKKIFLAFPNLYLKYNDSKKLMKLIELVENNNEEYVFAQLQYQMLFSSKYRINDDTTTRYLKNIKNLEIAKILSLFDFNQYLPGNILTKIDRSSMYSSLEVRSPFLNPYLNKLGYKFFNQSDKKYLKNFIEKNIKNFKIDKNKRGFSLPIKNYLSNYYKSHCEYYFNESKFEFVSKDFVKDEFYSLIHYNKQSNENFLWNYLILCRWNEEYNII